MDQVHEGHRKNLRDSFIKTGLEGKTEHQALEILITYAIPRIDVNPVAHELINKFGSLAAVMDADIEELTTVNHISENGAVLIKLIPQISKMYNKSKWGERPLLNNASTVAKFASERFSGEKVEILYMLSLDSHCRLIAITKISEGTIDESPMYIRNIVNTALRTGAKRVVLTHNHPSGSIAPSPDDIVATQRAYDALRTIDVDLVDHVIVSGDKTFCFSSMNLIETKNIE